MSRQATLSVIIPGRCQEYGGLYRRLGYVVSAASTEGKSDDADGCGSLFDWLEASSRYAAGAKGNRNRFCMDIEKDLARF